MFNVLDPPTSYTGDAAVGDGCEDDQSALQAMINADVGVLYFPPGKYRIDITLVFPARTGYHVIGSGLAQHVGNEDHLGARAALVWGGGSNGTMVRIEGSGLIWNGLTLWGIHP